MKTFIILIGMGLMSITLAWGIAKRFTALRADILLIEEQVNQIHEQTFDPDYPVGELITVYTSEDILYLQGNRITSESGKYDFTYSAQNVAIEVLAQLSADQSNQ